MASPEQYLTKNDIANIRAFVGSPVWIKLAVYLRLSGPRAAGNNEGELLNAALSWNGWHKCIEEIEKLGAAVARQPRLDKEDEPLEAVDTSR